MRKQSLRDMILQQTGQVMNLSKALSQAEQHLEDLYQLRNHCHHTFPTHYPVECIECGMINPMIETS